MPSKHKIFISLVALASLVLSWVPAPVSAETRRIVFPVAGFASYGNDFGDPRSGGRTHEGNDLFGKKMQPLIAAVDGRITFVAWPERSWGYSVTIEDADGYRYMYLHINNDTPGTDNGLGGGKNAYAPGVYAGAPVVKGQVLGYMGDSGNAESTPPHLHFEIHTPDRETINPYYSLKGSTKYAAPVPTPQLPDEIWPFEKFMGGANIASGNVDHATPEAELIVGAGPGGGPRVRVYASDGSPRTSFFAYSTSLIRRGVDVAAGDFDGNGLEDIITVPAGQPGPLRIFSASGMLLKEFTPFPNTVNGMRVEAGDIDGDGSDEIIVGAGKGSTPQVRVFSADGTMIREFLAYDPAFRGGIDVAVRPAAGLEPGYIVTGAGEGGGPDVRIFSSEGQLVTNFHAYARTFRGGVRLTVSPDPQNPTTSVITTSPSGRGGPQIRTFSMAGAHLYSQDAFEPWWSGGYDVAVVNGTTHVASGLGRRAAIQETR